MSGDPKPVATSENTAEPQHPAAAIPAAQTNTVLSSGKRQAFDDVIKPLTPEELASPGTQKLILYMLQKAQGDCDEFEGYVERFHDADKRAGILQEQLNSQKKISKAVEIGVIVGTAVGGILAGVALYCWGKKEPDLYTGIALFGLGLILIAGAVAMKISQK